MDLGGIVDDRSFSASDETLETLRSLWGGGNQGTRPYREAGYLDEEVGPTGQRQSGAGSGRRFPVLFKIIEKD